MSFFVMFGIDGDRGVGQKSVGGAAAGAHGARGSSGERCRHDAICKRRHWEKIKHYQQVCLYEVQNILKQAEVWKFRSRSYKAACLDLFFYAF